MKKILINKQIGSDFFENGITADFIRNELKAAKPNEQIQLIIDSPGGYVWDCITIYNVIRDFCRNHENRVDVYIQGIAMSCASVIACAAKSVNRENKIIVEDNSIFMIHNAWGVITGDENDMRAAAEDLAKIDAVIANAYISVTGKSDKEVRKLMDAESYFYGEEIVTAAFADSVIKPENPDNQTQTQTTGDDVAAALATAKAAWEETKKIMANARDIAAQKLAAMATEFTADEISSDANNTAGTASLASTNDMGGCMTAEEFEKEHPDEAKKLVDKGVAQERERADAHLKMGETVGALDVSAKFIREGKDFASAEVQTTYFESRVKNTANNERLEDNVPAVTTPAESKDEGIKQALAAFDAQMGVKL